MNLIVDKIIQVLKDTLPDKKIKNYFFGDIGEVAASMVPAVMVMPVTSVYEAKYTGYDLVRHTVTIVVVDDAKKYFSKSPQEASGVKELVKLVEGVDDNGALLTSSIAYVLRNKIKLDGAVTEGLKDLSSRYGFRPRGEFLGLEAEITGTALTRVAVSRE